jgi:hypothetical protein
LARPTDRHEFQGLPHRESIVSLRSEVRIVAMGSTSAVTPPGTSQAPVDRPSHVELSGQGVERGDRTV